MPQAPRWPQSALLLSAAGLLLAATLSAAPPPTARRTVAAGRPTPETIAARGADRSLLLLRVGVFDPASEALDFGAAALPEARPGRYGFVQLRPGFTDAKAVLEPLGVELLGYLPNDAFQVRWSAAARARVAVHPAVRAVVDYGPGLKVAPELWDGPGFEPGDRLTVVVFRGE